MDRALPDEREPLGVRLVRIAAAEQLAEARLEGRWGRDTTQLQPQVVHDGGLEAKSL